MADPNVQQSEVEHTEEAHGAKFYFVTWVYLLVLTVLEVWMVAAKVQPRILVPSVLFMTILKAFIIVVNFMHVRFERRSFLIIVSAPFTIGALLFLGIHPDFSWLLVR